MNADISDASVFPKAIRGAAAGPHRPQKKSLRHLTYGCESKRFGIEQARADIPFNTPFNTLLNRRVPIVQYPPFNPPVQYPRSIPPFNTLVQYPCSISLFNKYLVSNLDTSCTRRPTHTHMHTHTHTIMIHGCVFYYSALQVIYSSFTPKRLCNDRQSVVKRPACWLNVWQPACWLINF